MSKTNRRDFIGYSLMGVVGASLLGNSQIASAKSLKSRILNSKSIWDVPTPALMVDLDKMESNLDKMKSHLAGTNVKLRPHTKTHKSPIISKMQIERGAIGICTAKVSEAEVMMEGGIDDILITSPVVTQDKIKRVINLAKQSSKVSIVVDQEQNVKDLNAAAEAAGITLSVLIEMRMGGNRTGIEEGKPAIDLFKAIDASKNLKFNGIQAYSGRTQHVKGFDKRKLASKEVLAPALAIKQELEKSGHKVPIFTVGGTGTYNIDSNIAGVTDIQAGSYLFMDADYVTIGSASNSIYDDFDHSLFVISTAISQPMPGYITIDAGSKSFSVDKLPFLKDITGVDYKFAGDEHGILTLNNPSRDIKIGDKLLLVPSHCDPTINLYDNYVVYRGDQVEGTWPVAARGKTQ